MILGGGTCQYLKRIYFVRANSLSGSRGKHLCTEELHLTYQFALVQTGFIGTLHLTINIRKSSRMPSVDSREKPFKMHTLK